MCARQWAHKADIYVIYVYVSFFLFSDQCAQQDPPIGNVDKLTTLACDNYEYGMVDCPTLKIAIFDSPGHFSNFILLGVCSL